MNHLLFDWDEANIAHIAEHNITPDEAEQALDLQPMDIDFQIDTNEERISQLGRTATGRILVVISTLRGDKIRVVTAIPATGNLSDGERIRDIHDQA